MSSNRAGTGGAAGGGGNCDAGGRGGAIAPLRIQQITGTTGAPARVEFANAPGGTYIVWAQTTVSLPVAEWTRVGVARPSAGGTGRFEFLDVAATNQLQRFYQLRSR